MLVLTRKCGESVVVGDAPALTVTVMEVKAGRVRLGFDAAPDLPVYRLEIWERIRRGVGRPPRQPAAPAAPGRRDEPTQRTPDVPAHHADPTHRHSPSPDALTHRTT